MLCEKCRLDMSVREVFYEATVEEKPMLWLVQQLQCPACDRTEWLKTPMTVRMAGGETQRQMQ